MGRETRKRIVSKKHLARMEREQKQTRTIIIVSGIVLFAVLAFVIWGVANLVMETSPNRPVAKVNEKTITAGMFQARTRYYRYSLVQRWYQMYQFMDQFGSDPQFQQYFTNSLTQIKYQLDSHVAVGQQVADIMVEDIIIREEAERRGIVPDEAEVEARIQEFFAYFPNGTPTPEPTVEILPTSTLSPAQLAMLATSTPTVTQVITATPEVTVTVVPTQTLTPTPTLGPTPTSAPEPTATPYTYEAYQAEYETYTEDLRNNLKITEEEFRYIIEAEMLRQLLMEAITADLAQEQEQVWARHILVADEATAQEVLAKLEAGESFIDLAAQYSTDGSASTGGDLGWFTREKMVTEFSDVAFALEIGETSQPVQSEFGWHIIQVIDHQVLPISDEDFQTLQETKFQEWLDAQVEAAEVEIYEDVIQEISPDDPTVPDISQLQQQQPIQQVP